MDVVALIVVPLMLGGLALCACCCGCKDDLEPPVNEPA